MVLRFDASLLAGQEIAATPAFHDYHMFGDGTVAHSSRNAPTIFSLGTGSLDEEIPPIGV